MAAFHHLNDALFHQIGGVAFMHAGTAILDRTFGDLAPFRMQQVRHRLERCCLARPVATQQSGDAALGHGQADTFQHQDHVVVDHLDIVDLKQGFGLHFGGLSRIQHQRVSSCLPFKGGSSGAAGNRRPACLSIPDQTGTGGLAYSQRSMLFSVGIGRGIFSIN